MAETSQIINVPRDTTMQAGNTQLAAIVTKLQAICDALGLSSPLIADDFDPAVSYSPGDYCIKAGTLYRCNTATTADAPWDVTEWTATSVTQEFIRLQAILGDEDISAIGDGTVTGAITELNSTLATLLSKLFMTRIGILDGSNTVTIPSTATEIRLVEYNPSGGAAFESVDMLISEMPNPYIQVGESWVSVSGRTISSTPATGKVVRVYYR